MSTESLTFCFDFRFEGLGWRKGLRWCILKGSGSSGFEPSGGTAGSAPRGTARLRPGTEAASSVPPPVVLSRDGVEELEK